MESFHKSTFWTTVPPFLHRNSPTSSEFKQTNKFAGVGAHHHNGIAEQSIQTIMSRAILIHAAIHWPDMADTMLWLIAVQQACSSQAPVYHLRMFSLGQDGPGPSSMTSMYGDVQFMC